MNLKLSADREEYQPVQSQAFASHTFAHSSTANRTSKQPSPDNNITEDSLANRHGRLLAALPAGVIVLDGRGIVQEANQAAIELLGEPLSGERWINIIDRAFNPQPNDGHDVSLTDGRLVHISTTPLGDEPGQIILLQNVTETRALQSKVSHLQRLSTIGEVTARLAHQIRTPLSSAMLYLSPLLKQGVDEQVKQRFAIKMKDSLSHMEQLIRDLLAFSNGNLASPSPVSILALLTEVKEASNESEHRVSVSIDHKLNDDIHILGSQSALMSALSNLITNSRHACADNGHIFIRTKLVNATNGHSSICLSVEDDGCGIEKHDLDNILTPFFTTRSNGTGLGLAVVQSIVNAHRGSLLIDSEPQKGTTIQLFFPILSKNTVTEMNKSQSVNGVAL